MKKEVDFLEKLNEVGIALSKERKISFLHEKILQLAKELTDADGGTIYTVTDQKHLHFEIMISDSLHLNLGGTSAESPPFADLPLFLQNGEPNNDLIVTYAANHQKIVHVKDAYYDEAFDFSGTRQFDKKTGYRTQSVLAIPMKNHEDEVIAVLQLINPKNPKTGEDRDFTKEDKQLARSLASQAGIALNNQLLIESLKDLFDSLIRVVAEAIDEKSPSTGNHGKRVPILVEMLARAYNEEVGEKKCFTEEQLRELQVAAFLHDCGKISLPNHIVEKKTKLETIYDRIGMLEARFAALRYRKGEDYLFKKLDWVKKHYPEVALEQEKAFDQEDLVHEKMLRENERDLALIERCNRGIEMITEEVKQRLHLLSQEEWESEKPLLTDNELENLTVESGNLTAKERKQIEYHVVITYKMLSQLKFPKDLRRVPEIAAAHHERMDGKGYPRGLTGKEMPIQSRLLAIVDVFESLCAPDRPYRQPAPLSKVLAIMTEMVSDGHLDPDLFELFMNKKVHLAYGKRYLMPEQLDVD